MKRSSASSNGYAITTRIWRSRVALASTAVGVDACRDLENVDGTAANVARRAFACFEPYGRDIERCAWAMLWTPRSCENDIG